MMKSYMTPALYNYDVYPKVFLADQKNTVTIQPLGRHADFKKGHEYTVRLFKVDQGSAKRYPERAGRYEYTLTADEDGCIRFEQSFYGEGEYFIRIFEDAETKNHIVQLSVYSLFEDMKGRIPLRGDLHLHSAGSGDGLQAPEVFAAEYRGHGYDFMVISDHYKYYSSLEGKQIHEGLTDLNIVPGEEVHMPMTDIHYVNFGGSYSINALVTPNKNQDKAGDDLEWRSMDGNAPETMTKEEFTEMIEERAKRIPREIIAERRSMAVLEWIYEHIQKGNGLGIMPHPFWIYPQQQVPEDFFEYIYKEKPFDAFEVLGGSRVYATNGFQTHFYYDMMAKGIVYPVVGSTDSHSCNEYYKDKLNYNNLICSSIVFARENTREDLIQSIKDRYSVAVDSVEGPYRVVGEYRLCRYASFLLEHYFPLHDLACEAEGYYAKLWITQKDERAKKVLEALKGQIPDMQKKYFAV